jgi:hypothetical protein
MGNKALEEYFFFDDRDLDANRNGFVSENQLKKLQELDKGARNILIGMGSFFVLIGLIWPLISFFPNLLAVLQNQPLKTQPTLLAPLIWALVWGALACFVFYKGLFTSVPKITVFKVTGPVHFAALESGSPGSEIIYSLKIGHEKLDEVESALTEIMTEGDTYAVYFYDLKDGSGKHVLSLEHLS